MGMRKAAILIAVMAVMVTAAAGTALAKTFNGNDDNNTLIGTDNRDAMSGFGGDDVIRGYDRSDVLVGGQGKDRVTGNRGNDVIDTVDGSAEDFAVCGHGFDRVRADEGDSVATDCEDVRWVAVATSPGDEADCSDGADNDGDNLTDFPDDPGCSSATDPSEFNAPSGGGGGGDDDGGGVDSSLICHKPGTPAEKTKEVSQSALADHLGHGDTIGACDEEEDGD